MHAGGGVRRGKGARRMGQAMEETQKMILTQHLTTQVIVTERNVRDLTLRVIAVTPVTVPATLVTPHQPHTFSVDYRQVIESPWCIMLY